MDIWIAKLFKSGRVKRFAQSLHSRSSWATATSVSRSRLIAAGLCQWEGRGVDCGGANSERHYVASHRRARKSAQTRVAQCTVSRDLPFPPWGGCIPSSSRCAGTPATPTGASGSWAARTSPPPSSSPGYGRRAALPQQSRRCKQTGVD